MARATNIDFIYGQTCVKQAPERKPKSDYLGKVFA